MASSSVSSSASGNAADAADPFALIERGNAMESSGNLWSAADAFGQASVLLGDQARTAAAEISAIEAATSDRETMTASMAKKTVTERAAIRNQTKLSQKRRIAGLLAEQSRSYLHKARHCLLQALTFETQEDERRSMAVDAANVRNANAVGPVGRKLHVGRQLKELMDQAEPLVGMLPPSEARRRRRIFGRIYAGGEEEEEEEGEGPAEKAAAVASKVPAKKYAEEEKKQAEKEETKDDAAEGEATAEADAEMEAALLEEMDAEFGSSMPAAPGSANTTHSDGLDLPAAPSLPTMPKKPDNGGFDIPAAPGDGAGHIEDKKSSPSQPPPSSSSASSPPQPSPHSPGLGPLPPAAPTGENSATNPDSLESRLAQFDSSLPPEMKSQDERMQDIHKGLGRLGLHLPDNGNGGGSGNVRSSIGKAFQDHQHQPPKSEEDQIKEIMDMAADEARMEGDEMDPATVAAAAAADGGIGAGAGTGADGGDDGNDLLVIHDTDDLNAVLSKAGLTTTDLRSEVSKIEEFMGEDGKRALRDLKEGGQKVAERAQVLSLIAAAQELLFEASAFLEDDDEDVDDEEEEAEIMADGHDETDEDGAEKRKDISKKEQESDALRKGREGLVGAQKCLEKAIASLPPPT